MLTFAISTRFKPWLRPYCLTLKPKYWFLVHEFMLPTYEFMLPTYKFMPLSTFQFPISTCYRITKTTSGDFSNLVIFDCRCSKRVHKYRLYMTYFNINEDGVDQVLNSDVVKQIFPAENMSIPPDSVTIRSWYPRPRRYHRCCTIRHWIRRIWYCERLHGYTFVTQFKQRKAYVTRITKNVSWEPYFLINQNFPMNGICVWFEIIERYCIWFGIT